MDPRNHQYRHHVLEHLHITFAESLCRGHILHLRILPGPRFVHPPEIITRDFCHSYFYRSSFSGGITLRKRYCYFYRYFLTAVCILLQLLVTMYVVNNLHLYNFITLTFIGILEAGPFSTVLPQPETTASAPPSISSSSVKIDSKYVGSCSYHKP